jgi:hypothetical protein
MISAHEAEILFRGLAAGAKGIPMIYFEHVGRATSTIRLRIRELTTAAGPVPDLTLE